MIANTKVKLTVSNTGNLEEVLVVVSLLEPVKHGSNLANNITEAIREATNRLVYMDELSNDYSVGSPIKTIENNDGWINRHAGWYWRVFATYCNDNASTNNFVDTDDEIVMGDSKYAYELTKVKYDFYVSFGTWDDPEVTYSDINVNGFSWSTPGTPPGEDPDNGKWTIINSILKTEVNMSYIYRWGSSHFLCTNDLGVDLSLAEGLPDPLDVNNEVACLLSNEVGNPGFAIVTTRNKKQVLSYTNWVKVGDTLVPVGDPLYTWAISFPGDGLKNNVAFFVGEVEGVS